MWLFLAFLAIPLIEIGLFIEVGGFLGLWPTLAIVVATAMLGTFLVRQQGLAAMGDVRRSMGEFTDPTEPLAHAAMILVAAVLLLTPGFFTDGVGFALLVPPVRRAVMGFVRKRVQVHQAAHPGKSGATTRPRPSRDGIIEGEFSEVEEDPTPDDHEMPTKPSTSGWTRQ